jgi:hypothetical protein
MWIKEKERERDHKPEEPVITLCFNIDSLECTYNTRIQLRLTKKKETEILVLSLTPRFSLFLSHRSTLSDGFNFGRLLPYGKDGHQQFQICFALLCLFACLLICLLW